MESVNSGLFLHTRRTFRKSISHHLSVFPEYNFWSTQPMGRCYNWWSILITKWRRVKPVSQGRN